MHYKTAFMLEDFTQLSAGPSTFKAGETSEDSWEVRC
jgi:hypothetical protein